MESPYKGKPNIRRYCIVPARAMQDETMTQAQLKVLLCIGMYANKYGVCWPSQVTIGRHLGVETFWVSRQVSALIRKGYLRKLKHKDYPKGIKRRSRGRTNRYQVLWEGNDPLPSMEEFWALAPRFAIDPDDNMLQDDSDMQSGVKGDTNTDHKVLAQAFKQAVERITGSIRLPDPSFQAAKVLKDQGVTVDQVRDATAAMCKDALLKKRTPPLTLDQVAKWSGLYKK